MTNVLVGLDTINVREKGHEKLSTFNILSEYSVPEIKDFIRELIHRGYLEETQDGYSSIYLTKKAPSVLKGREQVFLTLNTRKIIKQKKSLLSLDIDLTLFNRLKTLRKKLADKEHVPPYVIFSDASLQEMARVFPQSLSDFINIKGVGEHKLKKYGEIFIKEITLHKQFL